jgi:hypothetical protein
MYDDPMMCHYRRLRLPAIVKHGGTAAQTRRLKVKTGLRAGDGFTAWGYAQERNRSP